MFSIIQIFLLLLGTCQESVVDQTASKFADVLIIRAVVLDSDGNILFQTLITFKEIDKFVNQKIKLKNL